MPPIVAAIFELLGLVLRAIGFLVVGLALGRFFFDHVKLEPWQLQVVLALGFFGLLIAITAFASPGSAGAFALGAGAAYFMALGPQKTEVEPAPKP